MHVLVFCTYSKIKEINLWSKLYVTQKKWRNMDKIIIKEKEWRDIRKRSVCYVLLYIIYVWKECQCTTKRGEGRGRTGV